MDFKTTSDGRLIRDRSQDPISDIVRRSRDVTVDNMLVRDVCASRDGYLVIELNGNERWYSR